VQEALITSWELGEDPTRRREAKTGKSLIVDWRGERERGRRSSVRERAIYLQSGANPIGLAPTSID
jgi:hypothetical protein